METAIFAIICAILLLVGLVGVVMPICRAILSPGGLVYLRHQDRLGTHLGYYHYRLCGNYGFRCSWISLLRCWVLKYKASRGAYQASNGLLLGIIIFQVWGIIVGPLLGALVGELISGKPAEQAFKSALGTFVGFIFGSLMKIVLILVMAGFFIVSLF